MNYHDEPFTDNMREDAAVDPRSYARAEDDRRNEALEMMLNVYYPLSPFTCSVGISGDGERYAAVGIKLFGDSTTRKGKWTRCAIAASGPVSEGLEGLVPKMRKLYQDYARNKHPGVNFFYRKRHTRSMAGK